MDATRPGTLALPLFLLFIALEMLWLRRVRGQAYPWREAGTSAVLALGYKAAGAATPLLIGPIYLAAWDWRVWTLPLDEAWSLAALFLGVEFAYYWFHRCAHECRWLWATHAVHHSPTQLNLSAAYRLGWTAILSGNWLFFLPLILVGFHPGAVAATIGLNLVYQFWLHTEAIGRLPRAVEWLFNTPSHHRVHHARNAAYLDRNYGGVLIVFDRLFGSFAAERAAEPCRYGLVKPVATANPLRLAFHEWIAMAADLRRARSPRDAARVLFGRPGASPAATPPDALPVPVQAG